MLVVTRDRVLLSVSLRDILDLVLYLVVILHASMVFWI